MCLSESGGLTHKAYKKIAIWQGPDDWRVDFGVPYFQTNLDHLKCQVDSGELVI